MLVSAAPVLAGDLEDGIAAHEAGDFPAALRVLQPLAEQGIAQAQTFLGLMHDEGNGVPLDDVQAIQWYRLAAGQRDARAQFLLGTMYDFGEGVPEDNAQAVQWYRLAAYPMADVIIDFGLDTHVVGDCVSACVMVFLAGEVRTMRPGSRLGFHQTTWEAENMRQFYEDWQVDFGWNDEFDFAAWVYSDAVNDVLVELRYMLERGVDPGFAIRTLDATPDKMWFPKANGTGGSRRDQGVAATFRSSDSAARAYHWAAVLASWPVPCPRS